MTYTCILTNIHLPPLECQGLGAGGWPYVNPKGFSLAWTTLGTSG